MKPTRDDLLEMLDNVSAALDNTLLAHGAAMTKADLTARSKLCLEARAVCDHLLRQEG